MSTEVDQHSSTLAQLRVPFYLFLNAASSIGIVVTNKLVFQVYNFKYGTLLTFIHFVITYLGLEVCRRLGVFEKKSVDLWKILPLCLSFCGFVALTNISLVYNSVGFYQLMKVLTTPLIAFIQTFFYNTTFTTPVKASLTIICVGVAIATVTDTDANMVGTLVATSALLVTAMYQIWVGTKQKELECNSYQLLYLQAPISAAILIPLIPLLDNLSTLTEIPSNETIVAILVSSILAFLVNLSIFLVIGSTSPITYNVLGHFKLTVILVLGFLVFGAPLTPQNVTGIVVTISGVVWYTHLKQNEKKPEPEKKTLEETGDQSRK
ncbi:triose phosphate transporter, putative [Bodo saltans]|uniref:Triose phosphate transporter, putative n=1 Tax=Bodo saltans TaxID=75058 RepID=A0A0S4JRZ1_BODSA|nr:triose phosphate transporter, putative [Bodo saltans]|eukprot:CUG92987.1 triose phosphate transporter, putative [Bodo saltans]